jgi:hypothetical protein
VRMGISVIESKKASILAWGALMVTLLVTDRIGTDPVNVGKMLLLCTVGFSLIPLIVIPTWRSLVGSNSWMLALAVLLLLFFISMLASDNAFERGLYGAFGRNTGFLSFLSLGMFFVTAAQLKNKESFLLIRKTLILAGFVNVVYCILAAAGFDIFIWSNPYNAVLGTFGNPNFIGSFMGIFSGVLFAQLVSPTYSVKMRLFFCMLWLLTFIVIYLADALQGLLVATFGITFTIYLYLRTKLQKALLPNLYLAALFVAGLFAVSGILQRGPLSSLLYKPSVSFRGDYWKTGISMGESNPIIGVGIDSYGLYYRTFRSLKSTISPGVDTTTDAAHNVIIDVFAGSGFFALAAYLFINAYVLMQALKYVKRSKQFDPLFVSLFIAWAGYQLQSVISINQLGLAVWGWTLGGAIIGYTRLQPNVNEAATKARPNKGQRKVKKEAELLPPGTLIKVISAGVVGLMISLPPFVADFKMREFLKGRGTTEALSSLAQSWPRDSIRLNKSIVVLAQSNRVEDAKLLAAFGTTVFPNDFASWSALYELSPEGSKEKLAYKERLHEIDPFNPKYFDQ